MTSPIPMLDLAPKRKKPLSLWNPLDYVVLLYWAFYFPQALHWYLHTFEKVESTHGNRGLRNFLQIMREDAVQRNLILQALSLRLIVTIGFSLLLMQFQISLIDWVGIVLGIIIVSLFSTVFGVARGMPASIGFGIVGSIIGGTTFGVSKSIATIIFYWATPNNITIPTAIYSLSFGLATGVAGAIAVSLAFSTTGGVTLNLIRCAALYVAGGLAGGVALEITISIYFSFKPNLPIDILQLSLASGLAFAIGFSLGGNIAGLRILEFLLAWIPAKVIGKNLQQAYLLPSRVTILPLPGLRNWLRTQLQHDPTAGLLNIDQLLRHSMQFIPAVAAINDWLADIPKEQLYSRVNSLAHAPYDWQIVFLGSAPFSALIRQEISGGFVLLPKSLREKLQKHWDISLRLDTPAHAACAGYWQLHMQNTNDAAKAFAHTRHIPHGEIMYQIAQALDLGRQVETLAGLAVWESESIWLERDFEDPLRPEMIAVLRFLRAVSREASIATISYSKLNRSAALSRAVVALNELLNDLPLICPELERPLVQEIIQKWAAILTLEAGKAGQATITQPVENPFVVGNPVTGGIFVGREEIFRRIEELWGNTITQNVPSLVLFGHRRMGKSSILQNLGRRRFGADTIVAQFTMQRVGRVKNTGELLGIFASKMHEALTERGTFVQEPDFASFEQAPYIAFDRFLTVVRQNIRSRRLILTIDEFELIEDTIHRGAVDAELLGYLRGVIHSERWFVLALAGLHTLEEMTADYWNPLFSSVTPVRVSFLTWEATANLLANPTEDFPLDFTREAIDRVYAHAHGQPFLTQLIGHTLVRLYNQSVFEDQTPREARFTAADVDEVIERAELYEQGHYYFQGVWSQAQGQPQGQLALLRALAQADMSLSQADWLSASGLDASVARESMRALLQHDVVTVNAEECYDFAVPLMRRWLRKGSVQ